MAWIDEECAMYAQCQLGSHIKLVTAHIGAINFKSPASNGDVVEFGMSVTNVGNTSITLACEVRNKSTKEIICSVAKVVFVSVTDECKPVAHNGIVKNF